MSWDSEPVRIIVIDDDPHQQNALRLALESEGVRHTLPIAEPIELYTDPADAVANLPASGRAVILCDYHMPSGSGVDWLPTLTRPAIGPVLILSAAGNEHIAADAMRCGAMDYLVKDEVYENPELLHRAMREALRRFHLESCNRTLARDLKIANADLAKKNQRLRELAETAHRFVDNVAHEFRTPLAVIQEFASILSDEIAGPVNERQSEFLGHVSSASRDLTHLVTDFLDSSKLKAGTLRVHRTSWKAEELVAAQRPKIKAIAEPRGVVIEEKIAKDLPEVMGDFEKAERTLANLVINAIKYSGKGDTVRLAVSHHAGSGEIVFSVQDHGPGISEDELEMLGQRFRQLGEPMYTSMKGYGLGLNIANELARLNLGRLSVWSKLGEGSTFGVTLPINDHAGIIRRYRDHFLESEDGIPLVALRVELEGKAKLEGDMAERLSALIKPTDLLLSGWDTHSAVILGPHKDAELWVDAIKKRWFKANAATPERRKAGKAPQLSVIGQWREKAETDVVVAAILNRMQEVARCA